MALEYQFDRASVTTSRVRARFKRDHLTEKPLRCPCWIVAALGRPASGVVKNAIHASERVLSEPSFNGDCLATLVRLPNS
jgi:hypothetical protein